MKCASCYKTIAEFMTDKNDRITSLESQLADALAVIEKKDDLISRGIENNLHLADGDNCTLKLAKEALAIKPGDVTLVEVGAVKEIGGSIIASSNIANNVQIGTKLYKIQTKE